MTQTIAARFVFRHGTAAQWTASNEVLLADEGGHESDTNKLKIGDGVTAWGALPYFGGSSGGAGGDQFAIASGTDVITAEFTPAPVLDDGLQFKVRAAGANVADNPTFNPNGLGALAVTKLGGQLLAPGDISGAGHEIVIRYKTAPSAGYELVNPASVQSLVGSINASIDSTNPRKPIVSSLLGVVNLKGRQATYADLPSSGNAAGDAWAVDFDTLIYVWNGTGWPASGRGIGTPSYDTSGTKFWRVLFTAVNSDSYVQISRLRFAAATNGSTLCLNGTPFASASYNSNLQPQYAFITADSGSGDGTSQNSWACPSGGIPAYLGYILPATATVNEVRIQTVSGSRQTQAPNAFTVQSSTDSTTGLDGTWSTEWAVSGQTGWSGAEIRAFDRP